MDANFPSLLLSLWLKTFIDLVVVALQRRYMSRSFSGFFCFSVALIDCFFSFIITAIYCLEDFTISGWRITGYHACLLVQVACLVCGVLHWPVFLLGVLDHFWTLAPVTWHVSWVQKLLYVTGACLLWILAACYAFWAADVVFLQGDGQNTCSLFSSSQCVQVLLVSLLTVACAILLSFTPRAKPRGLVLQHSTWGTQQSRFFIWRQIMYTLLNTWAPFITLMSVSPLLHTELNAYLQMNSVWLGFLNSFSVATALCSRSLSSHFKPSDVVTDGFCSWSFGFIRGPEKADKSPFGDLNLTMKENYNSSFTESF